VASFCSPEFLSFQVSDVAMVMFVTWSPFGM